MFDITFLELLFWIILGWIYNVNVIEENNTVKKSLRLAHELNRDLKKENSNLKDQIREYMIQKGRQ